MRKLGDTHLVTVVELSAGEERGKESLRVDLHTVWCGQRQQLGGQLQGSLFTRLLSAQRGRLVISPVQQKYLFSYRIQSTKISTKILIYAMNNMDTNVDMKKAKWMAFVYYGKPVNECF